ncbi:MAG: LbtU family siderophore porin [Candidatus Thiodiazotropha sp. (ex Ctena orbiculata)]|nr:LbtU family siderophore porin [Candidatus Thiodiazotropha taylori]MBT2997851.1 LbtU family siderophore porin [Candidatus Thiodiazotropha taylori]MBT3000380.1 LbtU family siderophore porin [Candidatus Thiodiazotropha taylori]MBV2107225.1 LbtU family siderophore porin [Candidatus Thiodiazotropha taylori]MBV2112218.1 LbtU family siderophore porin [Candidatus Thiodiazotropha taylori]
MSLHSHPVFSGFVARCLMLAVSLSAMAELMAETEKDDEPEADAAEEIEAPRIYRTREEQREAGLQTEITPWLTLSGLLEGEIETERFIPRDRGPALKARSDSATLQVGFLVDLFGLAEGEAVVEYDSDPDKFFSEEAFVTFEYEPWELSLGKQFTPLGLYFGRFVTGPMLEFGETSARKSALLTYGPNDDFDLTIATYQGRSSELGEDDEWDWAIGFEAWPSDRFSFGLSYQSDLSDADERLLEDDHYIKRVPVASAYLLGITDEFEFSLEIVAALDDFRELEKELDRPLAWNAEVAYFFPDQDLDLIIRLEKSRELDEEPEFRYGAAIIWYLDRRIILTMEYLRGQFETDSFAIEKKEEIAIRHVNTMSAKLTVEF